MQPTIVTRRRARIAIRAAGRSFAPAPLDLAAVVVNAAAPGAPGSPGQPGETGTILATRALLVILARRAIRVLPVIPVLRATPARRANLAPSGDDRLYIQGAQPQIAGPYLWVQTGLAPAGAGMTFWIEDGV